MNCYDELVRKLEKINYTFKDINYAFINCNKRGLGVKPFYLEPEHTDNSLKTFKENCQKIYYDNGYGSQELFGYIVFKDGSWLERHVYDGSEWWDYKKKPAWSELLTSK